MTDPTYRTSLPDSRQHPRFAGVATFCRFPRLEDVPPDRQPVDWIIYGIPYDGGTTYHPGARFGPRAVREQSQYMKVAHIEHGVNIVESFSLADGGDAPTKPFSCKQTLDAAAEFAAKLGDPAHTRLIAVGGDHSIAYANLRATWQRLGRPKNGLALIHFDAHLDTVDEIWDEKWNHGTVFRRAIEDGLVDPTRMISLGIRGPINSLGDLDYAREHGITILTREQCALPDAAETLEAFIESLGDHPTYCSFDIDSIDPAFAPGTGTPVCGGFSSSEALAWLRACAGVNLVGADVVEVLPDRDPAGITALLASHVIIEFLALAAVV